MHVIGRHAYQYQCKKHNWHWRCCNNAVGESTYDKAAVPRIAYQHEERRAVVEDVEVEDSAPQLRLVSVLIPACSLPAADGGVKATSRLHSSMGIT